MSIASQPVLSNEQIRQWKNISFTALQNSFRREIIQALPQYSSMTISQTSLKIMGGFRVYFFFLLNGALSIDNLNETTRRRKFTWMSCNDSDLPSTITAKLPSETQVDSSRRQKLAGLKNCYGDRSIQSSMTVKIFVGTDGFLPCSAEV
jgi:hypothetical protein